MLLLKSFQSGRLLAPRCVHSVAQSCLTVQPQGLYPARLLCPWHPPGKNTGVGCHFLLQGLFLTQGSNPHVLHLQHSEVDSLPLVPSGKPKQRQDWVEYYIIHYLSSWNFLWTDFTCWATCWLGIGMLPVPVLSNA